MSTEDVESFCDKRLLSKGTAMEFMFKCTKAKPSEHPSVKKCDDDCKSRRSSCSGGCDECDFQSDLQLVDNGLKQCMERAGFLIYWTQKSFPKNCGAESGDPNNNPFPWALRFSLYEKVDGYTNESDYTTVVRTLNDGEELRGVRTGVKAIEQMGVLIDKRTMMLAAHSVMKAIVVKDKYVGIISGGSDDSWMNLVDIRQTFIIKDSALIMPWENRQLYYDLAIIKLKREIPNTRPVCLPFIWEENFALDVSKLKTTGWGTDASDKPQYGNTKRYLKTPTIEAISPYWGPSSEACKAKCLCVHVTENDQALCKGDSGTGLVEKGQDINGVTRWQLVGVQAKVWGVSKQKPCSDYGTVHVLYGDIRKFKQWVCDHTLGICGGYYLG